MKKTVLILVFAGLVFCLSSQNTNSMYFLDEWSQRNTLNAAFAPENGHFSFPLSGGVHFNSSSNTGLSNYIYHYNDELVTFMHPSVAGSDFIDRLERNIYIKQGLKMNLLSFGFFTKNAYWSFNYNLEEHLDVNIPKDLFRLIKLGFENETNEYDLKNLSIYQSNISKLSVGYSRNINSTIRIGVNVKLLIGLSTEELKYNRFEVSLSNDRYEVNARGETLIMSDMLTVETDENNNFDFATAALNFSNKKPAGTGSAIDLGITYTPSDKWSFSTSINDLGLIYWKKTAINKGIATSNVVFTGFSIVNSIDSVNIENQLEQLEQDLKNLILFEKQPQSTKGVLKEIPYSINMSAEYSLFGNKSHDIRFGVLWNSYNSVGYHSNQLMGAITFKPFPWFGLSTTYSLFLNETNRLGLAMNFSPAWINIFLATDISTTKFNRQFLPTNKFNLNLQAGVSLYLGD